jgi:hypothetical protein
MATERIGSRRWAKSLTAVRKEYRGFCFSMYLTVMGFKSNLNHRAGITL